MIRYLASLICLAIPTLQIQTPPPPYINESLEERRDENYQNIVLDDLARVWHSSVWRLPGPAEQ